MNKAAFICFSFDVCLGKSSKPYHYPINFKVLHTNAVAECKIMENY